MNEKTTLEEERNVKVQIAGQEIQDKVETMSGNIKQSTCYKTRQSGDNVR